MKQRKVLLGTLLVAIVVIGTALYTIPRINRARAAGGIGPEPQNLSDIDRIPGFRVTLTDITTLTTPTMMTILNQMQSVIGVNQILADAHPKFPNVSPQLTQNCAQTSLRTGLLPCQLSEVKGTDPASSFFDIFFLLDPLPVNNTANPTGAAPTFLIAMNATGTSNSLAMYWTGNLLPPPRQPEVDPFLIVNAMPYWYVTFHWYTFGGTIVQWSYWWHDSHDHPNWFWGVYWWWQDYVVSYYGTYVGWWWYWWHWVYWQNWNWWSTSFPYYCNYATATNC